MYRLAVAALLGALVGAIVAAGVSLLAFTYPVQVEITNIPLDDSGSIRIGGSIETVIGVGTTGEPQASISELLGWRDSQTLQCVCSDVR
jgi:hydroxymethylglutaryl-CoA reductase